jgi:hypothetical protein
MHVDGCRSDPVLYVFLAAKVHRIDNWIAPMDCEDFSRYCCKRTGMVRVWIEFWMVPYRVGELPDLSNTVAANFMRVCVE